MPTEERQHVVLLAVGFFLSFVASLTRLPTLLDAGGASPRPVLAMFVLPAAASVTYLVLRSLRRRPIDAGDRDTASDVAVQAIVFRILLFLTGVHAIVLGVLVTGGLVERQASRAVVVLLGATLVGVGNLLPRTRPNAALGIRTYRTMTDRLMWMRTHRAGGYVCVGVGLVTVMSGACLSGQQVAGWPGVAALGGGTILLAYYRRLAQESPVRASPEGTHA